MAQPCLRTPINGKGCFFPAIPDDPAPRWALGSTFVTDALLAADIGTQHAENLARLRVLLPEGGDALAAMLDRGKTEVWSGTRCTTRDRLPLVVARVPGAHTHGLWLCTGMGSRGMSLVGLCAEWLAACMQGDDPAAVLDPSLARYIDTQRWRDKPATPSVAKLTTWGGLKGSSSKPTQPSCSARSMAAHEGCQS